MELASIIHQYYDAFTDKHGKRALPSHWKALNAVRRCRTSESGEIFVKCFDCNHSEWRPASCGNRNCPKCQNHEASSWIDRQQKKLLPVPYFMVTFTLPHELRKIAWSNQTIFYSIFFTCVASTLKDFGLNPKNLGAKIGMTMMLHTHSRKLDYHPHIHAVVPGGGVDKRHGLWRRTKGKYLFNQNALAKVFRERLLAAIHEAELSSIRIIPKKWVVHCTNVGQGISALKYLSRYLYRGVISEKNIVSNKYGMVTFKYTDSKSGRAKFRTLAGEDFLQLILQHVLPRGFRRVRDYGFLHGNAKKMLFLVQMILHVVIEEINLRPRPAFKCRYCKASMLVMAFRQDLSPG